MSSHKARCEGKERFASAALATAVVKRNRKDESKRKAPPRNAYLCRYCGGWHLGSSMKRVNKMRKRNGSSFAKAKELC